MIRMPSANVIAAKCFICLLLFLLYACNQKPKESAAPETVQPDTPGPRGEYEKTEAPASDAEETTEDALPESLQLSIYPNPASNNFYLELNEVVDGMEYFVVSSNGPTVLQGDIKDQKENIDVSELPSGSYVVQVTSRHKNSPTLGKLFIKR